MQSPKLFFSLRKLEENIFRIQKLSKNIFKNRNVKIFFAMKSNNHNLILNTIFKYDIGAEISNNLELVDIMKNNCKNFILNGHFKSDFTISNSIQYGVQRIYIESLAELKRIERISKKLNQKISIGIRVKLQECNKVGADINEIKCISDFKSDFIEIDAVHFHLGWNIKDSNFVSNAMVILQNSINILRKDGHKISTANIGGSFIEFHENPKQMHERFVYYQENLPNEITNVEIEPGRYFVGDCGLFYANVEEVRNNFVIINSCAYTYRLTCATPSVSLLNIGSRKKHNEPIKLSGHWAAENDHIVIDNDHRVPQVGDIVRFRNYGAYLNSWKSQLSLDENIDYIFEHPFDQLQNNLEEIEVGSSNIIRQHWNYKLDELKNLPTQRKELNTLLLAIQKWLKCQNLGYNNDLLLRVIYHDYSTLRRELKNLSS